MSFYSSQSDYQTVQGDKQTIDEQLELPDGTNPDLAGRSVEFVMRHMPSGAKVVSAAAAIDDAAAGSVSYTLSPDETGRAGLHHAEWILTGGDDDPTTLPVDEPVNIYIREDVEGDGPVAETLPDDIDGETITPAQVGTPDNPFAGHAGELSVGTLDSPALQDYTNVLETEESKTTTFYSPVGHTTGYYPPVNELSRGTMNVYIRIISQLKTSDSSATASFSCTYSNETDGNRNFFEFGAYSTSSTTYTVVDSKWQPLGNPIDTKTEPFTLNFEIKTTDGTFETSAKDCMVMVGVGP